MLDSMYVCIYVCVCVRVCVYVCVCVFECMFNLSLNASGPLHSYIHGPTGVYHRIGPMIFITPLTSTRTPATLVLDTSISSRDAEETKTE